MRNECEYQVLSNELNEKLFLKRTPLSGGIELTNKCNFRCVHCYETMERDGEGEIFSTARLLEVIDELLSMGVVSVFLTGGEAMLRPDFDFVYKYLRENGVLVAILSNGSTVTKEKCQLFQKYMPRMIDISLYGASEETYKKVTGMTGMFEKVIQGLNYLKEYKIPFQLKTVVLKENVNELDEMREIAKHFGVPFKFFSSVRPYNNGNREPIDHMLSKEEILDIEQKDKYVVEYFEEKKTKKVSTELSERQK